MNPLIACADALLFPDGFRCLVCDEEALVPADGVCAQCRAQLRRCEAPAFAPPLDGLAASLWYDPVLHDAMHRFKYKGDTYLARFFARYIELPDAWHIDAVVPVPMHPLKAYIRGYNPPDALALALAERYPSLCIRPELLRKIRLTPSQTGVSAEQRRSNIAGAFRADAAAAGLSILLLDDVATTRSTLAACASALRAQGAVRVYAACACCAVHA